MDVTAAGRFDIDLRPAEGLLPGTGRFDFTKTWSGEVVGTSTGVMLSAGEPGAGNAGYVALERFEGSVAGVEGALVVQQRGLMVDGEPQLEYVVVPGSGSGALAGCTGRVELDTADGDHRVIVRLLLP